MGASESHISKNDIDSESVQERIKAAGIPRIPHEVVGCEMYGLSNSTEKMRAFAAEKNQPTCMFSQVSKRWYVVHAPFDHVETVPEFATVPIDLTESEAIDLRSPMSDLYDPQKDVVVRNMARELLLAQMKFIEVNNKSPFKGVTIQLYLETAMDALRGTWEDESGTYVQQKLRSGFLALKDEIPRHLVNDRDIVANSRYLAVTYGKWFDKFYAVAKKLNTPKASHLPEEGNPEAMQQVKGWFAAIEVFHKLVSDARLARKAGGNLPGFAKKVRNLSKKWKTAGELILPGWFERTLGKNDASLVLGVEYEEFREKNLARLLKKRKADTAVIKKEKESEKHAQDQRQMKKQKAEKKVKDHAVSEHKKAKEQRGDMVADNLPVIGGILDEKWTDQSVMMNGGKWRPFLEIDMEDMEPDDFEEQVATFFDENGALKSATYVPDRKRHLWVKS